MKSLNALLTTFCGGLSGMVVVFVVVVVIVVVLFSVGVVVVKFLSMISIRNIF